MRKSSDELYHAWLRKGQKAKYIAKVPIGKGKYRYFYDKDEYNAYLKKKDTSAKKTSFFDLVKGTPSKLNGFFDEHFNDKISKITETAKDKAWPLILKASKIFPNTITSKIIEGHKYIAKVKLPDGSYRYFYDQEEYNAYLKREEYQANEPDYMKDLPEIDGPESFEDAMIEINEDYNTYYEYGVNCMLCSAVYELRRRGYDVEANPLPFDLKDSIYDEAFSKFGGEEKVMETLSSLADAGDEDRYYAYLNRIQEATDYTYASRIYEDPKIIKVPDSAMSDLYSYAKNNLEPNSRGHMLIDWKFGGAHSLNYEVDSKGNIKLIDSQPVWEYGLADSIEVGEKEVNAYADCGTKIAFMRTDNLEFTEEGVDLCARNN